METDAGKLQQQPSLSQALAARYSYSRKSLPFWNSNFPLQLSVIGKITFVRTLSVTLGGLTLIGNK